MITYCLCFAVACFDVLAACFRFRVRHIVVRKQVQMSSLKLALGEASEEDSLTVYPQSL